MGDVVRLAEPVTTTDFLDLCAEDGSDEPDWLIEGLLERQGRVLLAGDEGSGKSLLSLTLAVQAAAGLPVLGEWKVPVGLRVVYFEMEMSRRTVRRRSKLLRLAAERRSEIPTGELRLAHFPDGLNIGPRSRDAASILAFIERFEPDLVIFDPLYRMTTTDAVGEAETRPLIDFIAKVRGMGAATWTVHHTRKRQGSGERVKDSSDVYGSSILLRWPEAVLAIFNDGGKRGRLKVLKDREGFFEERNEWQLQRGGSWPIGAVQETPVEAARRVIIDHLAVTGPRSATAMGKDLGLRKQDVLAAVRTMRDDGTLVQVGAGTRTSWGLAEDAQAVQTIRDAFSDSEDFFGNE